MSQCQLCLAYIKNIKQLGEEKKALQRQIAALRNLLSSKGIMLNSEGEEELIELDKPEGDYDYAADDRNFDAARERQFKGR